MEQTQRHTDVSQVAACTILAAHRRDHQHGVPTDQCHPHAVEVVHLGRRAVMVCHDCGTDSGFLAHREAEHLAERHRRHTGPDVNGHAAGPDRHAA
jgi:hypothetical protein